MHIWCAFDVDSSVDTLKNPWEVVSMRICLADPASCVITRVIITQLCNVNHGCGNCVIQWRRKCMCPKQIFVPMPAVGWSTEQIKTKIKSVGQIGCFTCDYDACKAMIVFLNHLLSLLLLSFQYLRCSWVQLNNKIPTEQHTTASAYDFTQTLVVQSLLHTCPSPANQFEKVVWMWSMHIRCTLNLIPPDAHSDAHYSVNTPLQYAVKTILKSITEQITLEATHTS